MPNPVRLAVLGAGLIGKRHIQHIKAEPEAELLAIVDPSPEARSMALEMNVRWFPSFATLVYQEMPAIPWRRPLPFSCALRAASWPQFPCRMRSWRRGAGS